MDEKLEKETADRSSMSNRPTFPWETAAAQAKQRQQLKFILLYKHIIYVH